VVHSRQAMTSAEFFESHPVFTRQEFAAACAPVTRTSPRTADSLLRRYLTEGGLLRVRGGVYAVVPPRIDPARAPVDPYLIATKLVPNAVVAYHAALQFWGNACSVWHRFHYVTHTSTRQFRFRDLQFVPVQGPRALRRPEDRQIGVSEVRHGGGVVRVTSLERTLVDVLDAPAYAGGWEEIWRSLEMVEFFDLEAVVAYALTLGSALTIARLGFFLEQRRDTLMVDDAS
jgi:predicted transcriptional regulator of viral defense system